MRALQFDACNARMHARIARTHCRSAIDRRTAAREHVHCNCRCCVRERRNSTCMEPNARILPLDESQDPLVCYLPATLVVKLNQVGLRLLHWPGRGGLHETCYVVESVAALERLCTALTAEIEAPGESDPQTSTAQEETACRASRLVDAIEKAWKTDDAALTRSLTPIAELQFPASDDSASTVVSLDAKRCELELRSTGVSFSCLLLRIRGLRLGAARALLQEALERDLGSSSVDPSEAAKSTLALSCASALRWLNSDLSLSHILPMQLGSERVIAHQSAAEESGGLGALIESILGALGIVSPDLQMTLLEILPELVQQSFDAERHELALANSLPGLLQGAARGEKCNVRLMNTVVDTANALQTATARRAVRKSLLSEILSIVPGLYSPESLAMGLQFLVGALESLGATSDAESALLTGNEVDCLETSAENAIMAALRENLLAERQQLHHQQTATSHDAVIVTSAVACALQHSQQAVKRMLAWYSQSAYGLVCRALQEWTDGASADATPQPADLFLLLALYRANPESFEMKAHRARPATGTHRMPCPLEAATAYILCGDQGRRAILRWGSILHTHDGSALLQLLNLICRSGPKMTAHAPLVGHVETLAQLIAAFFKAVPALRQDCLLSFLELAHSESEYCRLLSLHAFVCIARETPAELAPFAPLVHGLAELCESLAPSTWQHDFGRAPSPCANIQGALKTPGALPLTLMYSTFALMHRTVNTHACASIEAPERLETFLPLMVRKLLTHPDALYQRCGCLATAILVETWSQREADYSKAQDLLELALQCTARRPAIAAQLYAELAAAWMPSLGTAASSSSSDLHRAPAPALWLLTHALQQFASLFIWMPSSDAEAHEASIPSEARFGLAMEGSLDLVIPVANLVHSKKDGFANLVLLVPLLRLIWCIGVGQHGYTSHWFQKELCPLLGAAVQLPVAPFSKPTASIPCAQLRDQMQSLAIASNWLGAQVHFFAVLAKQDMHGARSHLVERIRHLIAVETAAEHLAMEAAANALPIVLEMPQEPCLPGSLLSWLLAETAGAAADPEILLWTLRHVRRCDAAVIDANLKVLIRIAKAPPACKARDTLHQVLRVLESASGLDAELFCDAFLTQTSPLDWSDDETSLLLLAIMMRLEGVSFDRAVILQQWLESNLYSQAPEDLRFTEAVLKAALHLIEAAVDTAATEPTFEWALATLERYMPARHICQNQGPRCISCFLDARPARFVLVAQALERCFRIWCQQQQQQQQAPGRRAARSNAAVCVTAPLDSAHFKLFRRFAQLLKTLLDKAVRGRDHRALGASMRLGRIFADSLNRSLVPLWIVHFQVCAADIASACAAFQKSTRILQRVCVFAKEQRDRSLIALTPPLKRALELFLYRVKEMLSANASLSSFWMGTLRHKNLDGEVVSSQLRIDSDPSQSDDDAEETLSAA
jgi:hypothetical protein